jgi:hypothetical protein
MLKSSLIAPVILIVMCVYSGLVLSQNGPSAVASVKDLKIIAVTSDLKSNSIIAVPPATTNRYLRQPDTKVAASGSVDVTKWLDQQRGLNGLESADVHPWHMVALYDQFDEDGDNVHSGVYEEFWASPNQYKKSYKSDNFNQTDYGTEAGLFRRGDQQWPDAAETAVRAEIVDPFSYASTLQGFSARSLDRTFGGYTLQCTLIERNPGTIDDPTQYCFEPGGTVLRYSRGSGWDQTVYNSIETFEGRSVARDVEVTQGGKRYLKMHIETLESISHPEAADLAPAADAVRVSTEKISGVRPKLVSSGPFPAYPKSLRGKPFKVHLEIVVGKDGSVVSAHAVDGPPEAYKAFEDAVRSWKYLPYLVLGRPVEVQTTVEFSVQ